MCAGGGTVPCELIWIGRSSPSAANVDSKGGQIVSGISRALFLGRDGERPSPDIDANSKYWGGSIQGSHLRALATQGRAFVRYAGGAIPVAGARTTESVLVYEVILKILLVFELRRIVVSQ